VLVQRGWVPRNFEDRRRCRRSPRLPARCGERARAAARAVPVCPWSESPGPIRQNLDLPAYARETGLPLLAAVVQQTGGPGEGLLRDWPLPVSGAGTTTAMHFSGSACAP
jgi:surfeit locus 1 family protein